MTHSPRRSALLGSTALAVALTAGATGLAGCGSATRSASGEAAVKVSASPSPGAGVETEPGSATPSKDLPVGFPKDAVPLIDATVVTGTQGAPGGQYAWTVVMQTQRAIDDVAAEVKKDFTADGYRTRQADEMGDVTILQFADARYRVGVTVTRTGGTVTVTYVVRDR